MELKIFTTFRTIVRTGSFTKAARLLSYTPSPITFHIAQLEKLTGVPIFEKSGRRMILTKAGEELSFRQMEILLEELRTTPFPFTCPHGRPTILTFDTTDLAKMFKRTGFNL